MISKPKVVPMPPESHKHAIQCILDANDNIIINNNGDDKRGGGIWVGTMNTSHPLLRYHWH